MDNWRFDLGIACAAVAHGRAFDSGNKPQAADKPVENNIGRPLAEALAAKQTRAFKMVVGLLSR
jgi:hypothetical protein